MQHAKLVVVGDGAVGKSCFMITWTTNSFPRDYVPTVFDNYGSNVMVDGVPMSMSLWDTAGQEDYDRLRPLSYPMTDVFLVCFSIDSKTSFENVRHKWIPEVTYHCPGVPIVLVGMKSDLRSSSPDSEVAGSRRDGQVTAEQAHQLAAEMGCVSYCETSSLTQVGVNDCMMTALRAVLSNRKNPRRRRGFKWPWKRSKRSSDDGGTDESSIPPPPELPVNEKAPWINISSSNFAEDWRKLINSSKYADVSFELNSRSFHAHRLVLCASSDVFRAIFGINKFMTKKAKGLSKSQMWTKHRLEKVSMTTVNSGYVEGILSVEEKPEDSSENHTLITLDPTYFTDEVLTRVLTFLYTGVVDLTKDSEQLAETITAAHLLNLPELVTICENAQKGDEFLNPSIGTWLNDRNSEVAKTLFFNKELWADVHFLVDGHVVAAHKLVLCQRSEVMSAMLTGGFKESTLDQVEIPGVPLDTFLAMLEYLYTDHSPIEDGDAVGILALSNQYAVPRLMALCELYISKEVERLTAESIAQADLSVIDLLLTAQLHNAGQLSSWCLHFISSNYVVYCEQDSFSLLEGDNLDHVTAHRWPPLSYEQAMEEYRKKYVDTEDEDKEEEEEVEKEGPEESEKKKKKSKKGLKFLKKLKLRRLA